MKPLAVGSSPRDTRPLQILEAYGFYSTSGTNNISFNGVAGNGAGQTIAIVDAYNDPNIAGDLAAFDAQFGLAGAGQLQRPEPKRSTTSLRCRSDRRLGDGRIPRRGMGPRHSPRGPASSLSRRAAPAPTTCDAAVTTAAELAWRLGGVDELERRGIQRRNELRQRLHHAQRPSGRDVPGRDRRQRLPVRLSRLLAECRRGGRHRPVPQREQFLPERNRPGATAAAASAPTSPSLPTRNRVQSTGKRTVPDVSFDADPNTGVAIYDSYDNPTRTVDAGRRHEPGHARAGPAIIAIINQGRVAAGGTTLNGATQTLPGLYSLPSSDFHDITSGSNGGFTPARLRRSDRHRHARRQHSHSRHGRLRKRQCAASGHHDAAPRLGSVRQPVRLHRHRRNRHHRRYLFQRQRDRFLC